MKLRIKDWAKNFETAKSKSYTHTNKVCFPNKIGMGLSHVLSQPDGASIFGIFVLIVEACSTQKKPRRGYLTENGRKNSSSWEISQIAKRIRRETSEVERCLQVCMSKEVGWIIDEDTKYPCGIPVVSAQYPLVKVNVEVNEETSKRLVEGPTDPLSASADADGQSPKISYPTGFIQFWSLYPPRGRERSSRKKALAVWRRAKLEPRSQEVIDGLNRWIASEAWTKDGGQYVKNAHDWLSNEKFLEHPLAAPDPHSGEKVFDEIYPSIEQVRAIEVET